MGNATLLGGFIALAALCVVVFGLTTCNQQNNEYYVGQAAEAARLKQDCIKAGGTVLISERSSVIWHCIGPNRKEEH